MIIVGQDKKTIVNFDKVKSIWIDDNVLDKTNTEFEICADGETLGYYKTEEKAKEILQEIAEKYSSYLQLNGGPAILRGTSDIAPMVFNIPKVYIMPKE